MVKLGLIKLCEEKFKTEINVSRNIKKGDERKLLKQRTNGNKNNKYNKKVQKKKI